MSHDSVPMIPFNDLARGTAALRLELDAAISRVLTSGWYVLGPEHDAFEGELSAYFGVSQAILVGNGTDALQLALSSLGVNAGDTVLTAANAGGYTSTAARALGAVPVFADVDPTTHLLSVETLNAALRTLPSAPKVVVVTHLYGAACPMAEILTWAHAHDLLVLEDCAQSIGASIEGRKAGSFGDIAITSFYPTKNLGALGDGGAILTSLEHVGQRARKLRQYGWDTKYSTSIAGGRNSRLDEMQAAILRVKLPHLDSWNEKRRTIHSQYEEAIQAPLRLVNASSESFVGHLAVVESLSRDSDRAALTVAGVKTQIHYPIPDHLQPLIKGSNAPSLPVTEALAKRVFSLPIYPELMQVEVDRVAGALKRLRHE